MSCINSVGFGGSDLGMSWDVSVPVCDYRVCFLCHILGWRFVLVSVTGLVSQELLVLAENTGASGQGLRFQEEPTGVRQGDHTLLSAPLGLPNSLPSEPVREG